MRKITPKPLMKLRDAFVIIKEDKLIANHNLYSLEGELLSPGGYPIPKYSTSQPYVGDQRNISHTDMYIMGAIIAEGGRFAEIDRQWANYGSYSSTRAYQKEGSHTHFAFGFDCILPGIYRQKSGDQAGRLIARHPTAFVDVTSDVMPIVLETSGRLAAPESNTGGGAITSNMHAYPARIFGEMNGCLNILSQFANWSASAPHSAVLYPVQTISKDFSTRYRNKAMTGFQYPMLPIEWDEENKILFSIEYTGTTNNSNGQSPLNTTIVAMRFNEATSDYDTIKAPTLTQDSYLNTTNTLLGTASRAGYRSAATTRAVLKTQDTTSIFVPAIKSRTDSVATMGHKVASVDLRRYDYDIASNIWTTTVISNVIEESTGLPPSYLDDEQFILVNDSWPGARITETDVIVHFDSCFVHSVDNETYLVVFRCGSLRSTLQNVNFSSNTLQYTYRLDPADKTKAVLVQREVLPAFFGYPAEGLGAYAGNKDLTRLYVLGNSGILRLKFDESKLKYVLDDTMINIPATSLLVTDTEDLWALDSDNKLYNMRANNTDIVRVAFAEGTNTEFAEAPYDIEVCVSTVDHLGKRGSRSVELVVEGNATFKANNRNKITITTSATDDVTAIVTVKDYGQIYVTPTSVT